MPQQKVIDQFSCNKAILKCLKLMKAKAIEAKTSSYHSTFSPEANYVLLASIARIHA